MAREWFRHRRAAHRLQQHELPRQRCWCAVQAASIAAADPESRQQLWHEGRPVDRTSANSVIDSTPVWQRRRHGDGSCRCAAKSCRSQTHVAPVRKHRLPARNTRLSVVGGGVALLPGELFVCRNSRSDRPPKAAAPRPFRKFSHGTRSWERWLGRPSRCSTLPGRDQYLLIRGRPVSLTPGAAS